MLQVQQLTLTYFKNYIQRTFRFEQSMIAICGPNGSGKTNVLDAIYHLCFTKSYFSGSEPLNHHHPQFGWRIDGEIFTPTGNHRIVCLQAPQGKKEMKFDNIPYAKLSAHIGKIPAVFIGPDDIALINEGSESRRSYLDALISQIDHSYLESLISYNKCLQQRNAFLKSNTASANLSLLDTYDQQLTQYGSLIFAKRNVVTQQLFPMINAHYARISNQQEQISWIYKSGLLEVDLLSLLQQKRSIDFRVQRTTEGIHRDDLIASMNEQIFRNIASQGQKKSLLFAMKLAAYDFIRLNHATPPILLLDDVFEKLDEQRILQLLTWVGQHHESSIFITDTHADRIKSSFVKVGVSVQLIEL